jgi:hypothetical protein
VLFRSLIGAVAKALVGGPPNTVVLMLRGPMLPEGMGDVTELDRLAASKSPVAGLAAFDAAHILSMLPQRTPSVEYWTAITARFERAAKLFTDPQQQLLAQSRAEDAQATATAIREAQSQQK